MTLTLAALAAGIPVLRASAVLADPGPSNGRPGEFTFTSVIDTEAHGSIASEAIRKAKAMEAGDWREAMFDV
jgi:hypothetical protein